MNFKLENLRKDEQIPLMLGQLYQQFGYTKFKMEKFEEYDFYAENKNFLKSHKIITFPDSEGKLVALKPDITLSIIKNTKADAAHSEKRFYNENVYRVSKYTGEFCEICQTGLEYMGNVTVYTMTEILGLAMRSLELIEKDYVLSIANVDFLTALISDCTSDSMDFKAILRAFNERNPDFLSSLADSGKITSSNAQRLKKLMNAYGNLSDCIPVMKELSFNDLTEKSLSQFTKIAEVYADTKYADKLKLDFSIVEDITYYNGLVFQGFVSSVPHYVLSGGRYDKLLKMMNKNGLDAIGFAVYLDDLERYIKKEKEASIDTMLLYDDKSDIKILNKIIDEHLEQGKTFFAEQKVPEKLHFSKIIKIEKDKATEVKGND